MAKKWLVGVVAAFAILGLAGVGFAAFTASANVYGNASAASPGISVSPSDGYCATTSVDPSSPGAVYVNSSDLVPGVPCGGVVKVTNTGNVKEIVTSAITDDYTGDLCTAADLAAAAPNCYFVSDTQTGLGAGGDSGNGLNGYYGVLLPGDSFLDNIEVLIPAGSTSVSPSEVFTITFTASQGA
jgi:hypothetical protein